VSLRIVDIEGKAIATVPAPDTAGLNKVIWDLQTGVQPAKAVKGGGLKGGGGKGAKGGPANDQRRPVPNGVYRAVLTVDGREHAQVFVIEGGPNAPPARLFTEEEDGDDDDRDS